MISKKIILRNSLLIVGLLFSSFLMNAQEAGDVDLKKWKVVVPVDSGDGVSTELLGKQIKKVNDNEKVKKYFRQNSNYTYELKGKFTGVNENGRFSLNQGEFSSTEFVEVGSKKDKGYWSNSGNHQVKTRLKCYKVEGQGSTYVARIRSLDKDGKEYDKVRVMWRDGYVLAEVHETYYGGTRYKRTRIGEVGENMFNITLRVTNGNVYISIHCKRTDLTKKNISLAQYSNTKTSKNLFRVGNFYKNDQSAEDSLSVQLKYITLTHSDKYVSKK